MSSSEREDRMVDWILGKASEEEAQGLRHEAASDPAVALDAAELRCLFDDLRELTVEPTSRVIENALREPARSAADVAYDQKEQPTSRMMRKSLPQPACSAADVAGQQ